MSRASLRERLQEIRKLLEDPQIEAETKKQLQELAAEVEQRLLQYPNAPDF